MIPLLLFIHGLHWFLMALCTKPWQMVLLAPVCSIGRAYLIVAPALVDHMAPIKKRGTWVQLMAAFGPLGLAAGNMVGGSFSENWRIVMSAASIIEMVVASLLFVFMKRSEIQFNMGQLGDSSIFKVCKKFLTKKGYVVTVILDSGVWSPMAAWATFGIKMLQARFYDGEQNKRPVFIFGISVVVAGGWSIFGGWLMDRYIVYSKIKDGEADPKTRTNAVLRFFFMTYP